MKLTNLTDNEKREILKLIEADKPQKDTCLKNE